MTQPGPSTTVTDTGTSTTAPDAGPRTAVADAVEAYLAAADASVVDDAMEQAAVALLPISIQPDDRVGLPGLLESADRLRQAVSAATAGFSGPSVDRQDAPAPGGPAATAPDLALPADGTGLACWLEFARGQGDRLGVAARDAAGDWTEIDVEETASAGSVAAASPNWRWYN